MQFRRFFSATCFIFVACVFASYATAQFNADELSNPFSSEPQFLPVEEAFQFDYQQDGNTLTITFDIAEGYYLYKKQFKTKLKGVELGEGVFPESVEIEDEFFGISEVFYNQLSFSYPISTAVDDGMVALRYQGCAEAGLCYPPTIKQIYLNAVSDGVATTKTASHPKSEQFDLAERLADSEEKWLTLAAFLGLGVLLAFTPCVFPMYPILSGIVIGQGKDVKTSRAFSLSFIYVQGMALTYSILGVIVASAGVQFQAALQHPVLLSVFIGIFVLLAFAMFGTYQLQLPCSWQQRLNHISNQQKRGNSVGVFIMGALSGLVASPCTTAPLTAILLYIAQHGDLVFGFVALYILSLGMGIPLIIFGVTGGKLLPKAGNWMNVIKVTFGFMMLAVAIFFLERLWISQYTLLLYAVLGLIAFSYYFVMNSNTPTSFMKGARTLVIFLGLFASAMTGYQLVNTKLLGGSASIASSAAHGPLNENGHPPFVMVKDLADFEAKLADANAKGKTVMVDLYADWCVACKEFEAYTFPAPEVVNALSNTVWMQIDLTHNTPTNLEFQKHFDILGLPTILFFNTQGLEVYQSRITGFMKPEPFAAHINGVLKN